MPIKYSGRKAARFSAYNKARDISKRSRFGSSHRLSRKRYSPNVQSIIDTEQKKEVFNVNQEKTPLTKEEKLRILDELAGSADQFSPEGVLETIRIADRGDWKEETE